MLFCIKCGQECNDDLKVCPNCGADLAESVAKKKKIKKTLITIGSIVGALILIFVILVGVSVHNENKNCEKALEVVQNGYLGNYNSVSVKDFFDFEFSNDTAKWNSTAVDTKKFKGYVVEFTEDYASTTVWFQVPEDFSSFRMTHFETAGTECDTNDLSSKTVLDTFYLEYSLKVSNSGIIVDYSLDNDTYQGSVGPLAKNINIASHYTIDKDGNVIPDWNYSDDNTQAVTEEPKKDDSKSDNNQEMQYVYDKSGLSYSLLDFDTIKYNGTSYEDNEVAVKAIYGGDYNDDREGVYGISQYGGLILNPDNSADNMVLVLDNQSTNFVNAKGVDELSYKNVIVKGYLRMDLETGEPYIEVTELEAAK